MENNSSQTGGLEDYNDSETSRDNLDDQSESGSIDQ